MTGRPRRLDRDVLGGIVLIVIEAAIVVVLLALGLLIAWVVSAAA